MKWYIATKHYKLVNGKMLHDGYFVVTNGLKSIPLNYIKVSQ